MLKLITMLFTKILINFFNFSSHTHSQIWNDSLTLEQGVLPHQYHPLLDHVSYRLVEWKDRNTTAKPLSVSYILFSNLPNHHHLSTIISCPWCRALVHSILVQIGYDRCQVFLNMNKHVPSNQEEWRRTHCVTF